jgi:hypothetical protein
LIDRQRHGVVVEAARSRLELAPIALEDRDIELILEAGPSEELLGQIYELLPVGQADALTSRVIDELDYTSSRMARTPARPLSAAGATRAPARHRRLPRASHG